MSLRAAARGARSVAPFSCDEPAMSTLTSLSKDAPAIEAPTTEEVDAPEAVKVHLFWR